MFEDYLEELAAKHLTRRLLPLESGTGPVVRIAGRDVLLFASNDYLGLAGHPEVVAAAVRATETYGAGSGAARLVSGSLPPHQQLEQALAQFKGTESALTFGSGYLANVGAIPALIGRGGLILADRLCHASLIDGCRLSGADFRIYRHNDVEHLAALLAKRRAGRRTLIVTDGVFSMDGDLAPLPELATPRPDYTTRTSTWTTHMAPASWARTAVERSSTSGWKREFHFRWEHWESRSAAAAPISPAPDRSIRYLCTAAARSCSHRTDAGFRGRRVAALRYRRA